MNTPQTGPTPPGSTDGPDGSDGSDGSDGLDGPGGPDDPDGMERVTGPDGMDGAGGADGPDGVWLTWRAATELALYGTGDGDAGTTTGAAGAADADADGAGADGADAETRTEAAEAAAADADGVRADGGAPGGTGPGNAGAGGGGSGGFFVREAPSAHFRTSVHASPLFAVAVARLLRHVDDALGRPAELAMVDVGAGRGELLTGVLEALPADVAARVRPCAVERAPRPEGLDERIEWFRRLPDLRERAGLLFANEWLDNVPVDIAETDSEGVARTVLVRTSDGAERLGEPVSGPEADWLERWWPLGTGRSAETGGAGPGVAETDGAETGEGPTGGVRPCGARTGGARTGPADRGVDGGPAQGPEDAARVEPGLRAEIGLPRDEEWASAVRTLTQGLAVAVDFAHVREDRPPFGTLTGYLDGREVRPVPDGSRDLTAHVAIDACAAAGARAAAGRRTGAVTEAGATAGAAPPAIRSQRVALHSLGIDGARPPLSLASSDPAAYVRQLASAGQAAELTATGGLGSFSWLIQPLGGVPSPFG